MIPYWIYIDFGREYECVAATEFLATVSLPPGGVGRQQVSHLIPHLDRLGHHIHLVTVHPRIVLILQCQVAFVVGGLEHFDHGVQVEIPVIPARLQFAVARMPQMDMAGIGAGGDPRFLDHSPAP